MILNNTQNTESPYTNLDTDIEFGLDPKANRKIVHILRSQLYSDKLGAFIRELVANARDANVAAGRPEAPVQIYYDPDTKRLYIEDNGPGLTIQEFKNNYTKYGSTTKAYSNELIGVLGLGSKSPYAYADEFFVYSYTGYNMTCYHCYLDENNDSKVAVLETEDLVVPKYGLKIGVPLKDEHIPTIRTTVSYNNFINLNFNKDGYNHFWEAPHLSRTIVKYVNFIPNLQTNIKLPIQDLRTACNPNARMTSYYEDGFTYTLYAFPTNFIVTSGISGYLSLAMPVFQIVMGNITYDATGFLNLLLNSNTKTHLDPIKNILKETGHSRWILFIKIGDASVTASREAIELDQTTQTKLFDIIEQLQTNLKTQLQEVVNRQENSFQLLTLLQQYSYSLRNFVETTLTWRDRPISISNERFRFIENDHFKLWVWDGNKVRKTYWQYDQSLSARDYIQNYRNQKAIVIITDKQKLPSYEILKKEIVRLCPECEGIEANQFSLTAYIYCLTSTGRANLDHSLTAVNEHIASKGFDGIPIFKTWEIDYSLYNITQTEIEARAPRWKGSYYKVTLTPVNWDQSQEIILTQHIKFIKLDDDEEPEENSLICHVNGSSLVKPTGVGVEFTPHESLKKELAKFLILASDEDARRLPPIYAQRVTKELKSEELNLNSSLEEFLHNYDYETLSRYNDLIFKKTFNIKTLDNEFSWVSLCIRVPELIDIVINNDTVLRESWIKWQSRYNHTHSNANQYYHHYSIPYQLRRFIQEWNIDFTTSILEDPLHLKIQSDFPLLTVKKHYGQSDEEWLYYGWLYCKLKLEHNIDLKLLQDEYKNSRVNLNEV